MGLLSWVSVLTVIGLIGLVAVVPSATMMTTQDAHALATGPKAVSGYVYASGGVTPVTGATVVVTVFNGSSLRATLSTSTDSFGFYTVTFAPSDWDVGNFILVAATYSSQVGEGNVFADGTPDQNVNIVLGGGIPEFGTPAVMIVVVMALVGMFAVRSRKK